MDPEDVLARQVDYYRERAAEYDDWWFRRNQFDDGPEFEAAWIRDVEKLRSWLSAHGDLGEVLELAAGTGNWTSELARRAAGVLAVDASDEVLAINAAKVHEAAGRVTYLIADIFAWTPLRRFDTVFFAFWISHVPEERWATFWRTVGDALAPGGRVLFIDNASPGRIESRGPRRRGPVGTRDRRIDDDRTLRTLRDGRTFEIVKRHWAPAALETELATIGWSATCAETDFAFLYGEATKVS